MILWSNISWSRSTVFFNNSCDLIGGGLLLLDNSRAEWSGNTIFRGNKAQIGGGIYLTKMSTLNWTGQTEFVHNIAEKNGGAIGSTVPGVQSDNKESTVTVGQSTGFFNNTCGENGGALALTGKIFVEFLAEGITFLGNSAKVAGGAVFVSGADFGMKFYNVSFVSNSAKLGGGVYATSSGNAELQINGEDDTNPTTFKWCEFKDNRAEATGGAIQTAAGQDVILYTSFVGNKADVGGALRLAGTASIDSCSFEDNISDEEGGPAVSNIGYISSMTNNSFRGNAYDCESGTFLNYNEVRYCTLLPLTRGFGIRLMFISSQVILRCVL